MAETTELTQNNASGQPESGTVGEPSQGSGITGESVEQNASAKREPGAEGLFDGMDAPTLHKSYKALQGEYTRMNEQFKQLEKFGGPSQMVQWAEYLSNNPRFSEWVKSEQGQSALGKLGIDDSQLDEDGKKAYDTVRKISEAIADNIADAKVKQVLQREIAPLSEAYKQQLLEKHFENMDSKYGKEWHEMRDTMSELSENLPAQLQDRPTFEDLEDLYFKALRKAGKFDSYAAKQYQKTLTEKKQKATEKPGTTGESAPQPARTIQEAFAMAKRAHNI